jgi:hypothetical protein
MDPVPTDDASRPQPTPGYRDVLRLAEDQARRHGHHHLGVEHLMLGILDDGQSVATGVLEKFVDLPRMRVEIERVLGSEGYHRTPRPRQSVDEIPRADSMTVTLVRGDERQDAMLHWVWQAHKSHDEAYRLQLEWPGPTVDVTAHDLFEALARTREQLEPQGWLIAVQGSRRDAFPSKMQRDMGGGLNVHLTRTGEPATLENVVATFAEADPSTLATVAEQRKHVEQWSRSLRGDVPSGR